MSLLFVELLIELSSRVLIRVLQCWLYYSARRVHLLHQFLRATAYIFYSTYMPRQFCLSIHPSICPSHACIVSKRLNVSSKLFHCLIGSSFLFFVTKGRCVTLMASPLTGAPNTRGSDFRPICDYISETVIGRGIVTMEDEYKVVCALSNSATFDDLEWSWTPVSRSQYSLKANISQTVHLIPCMFGSKLQFSGSADRLALFAVRQNPRWRLTAILDIHKWQ